MPMLKSRKLMKSRAPKLNQTVPVLAGLLMSRGNVGARTGGKGSWRRKAKKTPKGGNQEGQKVWAAALRAGCRNFGELDTATMMFAGEEKEALSFTKPQLALDMRSNTFVLMGKAEKKPMDEVVKDMIASFDFSKLLEKKGDDKAEGADDIGDVPEDVDFSKPAEGGETPAAE